MPWRATALDPRNGGYAVKLDDGTELLGRGVVVATGARYRRLGLPRQEEFEGAGIYYAATDLEARVCAGEEVVVVGGGNSAGQAAMFLTGYARLVHLVYRGPDLSRGMSNYLTTRLEHAPNVRIHLGTEVRALRGTARLEEVVIAGPDGDATVRTPAVFAMIGADPCTDWLAGTLALDERGFVRPARRQAPVRTTRPTGRA